MPLQDNEVDPRVRDLLQKYNIDLSELDDGSLTVWNEEMKNNTNPPRDGRFAKASRSQHSQEPSRDETKESVIDEVQDSVVDDGLHEDVQADGSVSSQPNNLSGPDSIPPGSVYTLLEAREEEIRNIRRQLEEIEQELAAMRARFGLAGRDARGVQVPGRQPPVFDPILFLGGPLLHDLVHYVWNSRVARLWRLFLRLADHYIDWNRVSEIVIRFAIGLMILTYRLQRRVTRTGGDFWWSSQHLWLWSGAAFCFLWQIGYLQYLYKFFVQKDYIERVLFRNETVDAEQELTRARQEAAPRAPPHQPWEWRDWFRIHVPPNNPILRLVDDLCVLVATFLFSIFPMWQPEAMRQPPEQQQLLPQEQIDGDPAEGDSINGEEELDGVEGEARVD